MKERVKAWVPYGLDADPVLHRMAMGLLGCVLVSLRCPISCAQGWDKLYKLEGGRKVLRTGVTMLPFRELVSWSFMGFGLFFAALAVLAAVLAGVVFTLSGRRLRRKLEEEYGERRH